MKLCEKWRELIVPKDLVYFRHDDARLVSNPELGAWCLLDAVEWRILASLARGHTPEQGAQAERTIAKLVLHYLVYLPEKVPATRIPDPPLKILYYAITEGCNLRCPYCYASSEKCLPGEMTTEESKDLMLQAAEMKVSTVVITGGEPLLRKDLFEVASTARRCGVSLSLITNGTLIRTPEIANQISNSFDAVTISIDGGTAEIHERTRGSGTFAKVSRALELLNLSGIAPDINHVVSPGNVESFDDLFGFLGRFSIGNVRLMLHSRLGRARHENYRFQWSNFMQMQTYCWEHPRVRDLVPNGSKPNSSCSVKGNCGMAGNEIYVNSLGDLYPCKLVTEPKHRAGNVRQQRLDELFYSPLFLDMRKSNVFVGENLADCRECYIRGSCGGGCRAYHSAESGEIYKNGRNLCRMLRHSMLSKMWLATGISGEEISRHHEAMFRPLLVRDDVLHPVYEDWKQSSSTLFQVLS